ncbi:MAG: hypothetical protein IT445_10715 [Phycisphaeraceae bacterium]|nr:hypothetical protein [Phycisphaeraceae bacterium]
MSSLPADTHDRGSGVPFSHRLTSIDVYRGIVILVMLWVGNPPYDQATIGYFWKHAPWPPMSFGQALVQWWSSLMSGEMHWHAAFSQFPLWTYITLADYVFPSFMLIIGLAIPFSVAAAIRRGTTRRQMWGKVGRRVFLLMLLGWTLGFFRDQCGPWLYGYASDPRFQIRLGLDILQLLALGYLVTRLLYILPTWPRLTAALVLFLIHWAFLRFYPQGDFPTGTFTTQSDAIGYATAHWPIWQWITLRMGSAEHPWLVMQWNGAFSILPDSATMVLGTLAGDWLRRQDVPDVRKVKQLALWGAVLAVVALAWSFDLPFAKQRRTPCYSMWVAGVGFLLLAWLYRVIDMRRDANGAKLTPPAWTHPFVVLGTNAIAAYFLPDMTRAILNRLIRVTWQGELNSALGAFALWLQSWLGQWTGGWALTVITVTFWYGVFELMYRRRLFFKL